MKIWALAGSVFSFFQYETTASIFGFQTNKIIYIHICFSWEKAKNGLKKNVFCSYYTKYNTGTKNVFFLIYKPVAGF